MAHDLLFGRTQRNWSRGSCLTTQPISDEVTVKLTESEMNMLADLASTKMLADLGDKSARKKMRAVSKKVAGLKKQAKRGDSKAKRALYVLNETGVFRGVQSFSMGGVDSSSRIPNTAYRATIVKQAAKLAGNKTPSTKHFYLAKKAVDNVMDNAGISLYLPGSRPGRVMRP
jgi:hypothetical protein